MIRLLAALLLLGGPLLSQATPGRVVVEELEPESRRDDPIVFAVYAPSTWDGNKPLPLILALHAGRGTARQFAGFLMPHAEAQNSILVAPQGLKEIVGADGYWWKGDRAEMRAIERVLEYVRKRYRIDATRFTVVGLADGAELGLRWAMEKDRGLTGLIALNFLWRPRGAFKAPKEMKVCLIASREAKEKSQWLKDHAEKARLALERARYPVVLRLVPGASRSFFHGWEKEFRAAYEWFGGERDWPAELAEVPAPPPPPPK